MENRSMMSTFFTLRFICSISTKFYLRIYAIHGYKIF
nr:MAG TPA: hypothetical protein [Caudoviricetes sp.]